MKRKFKIILLSLIFVISSFLIILKCNAEEDNKQILREGTFVKVMPLEEISTLTADIEDEVTFINTSDMYVYETNAIPKSTLFYGVVEDLKEPVAGKDAAIKIAFYKMITPDKKVYKIKGHLYNANDNYLGGRNTAAKYYRKVPHYKTHFQPILQAVPLEVYEMGKHTIIMPGSELFLVIEDDIVLK